ncbi:FCD domain-containing protein [Roseomonas sp. CCTCC AB2023176]|uniref:FCD domain-containing protein n=1 Tax=Roseomonas sp. CCTCC AB2023176 TaxID=3342640 RepID=UPI0035DE17E9
MTLPGAKDEDEALLAALRARLAAGGPLPAERALADALSVKRHRVRAALEALRAAGEIGPSRPGRRAGERRTDELVRVTNSVEVVELRLILEPGMARLAAVRASPMEVARIVRLASTDGVQEAGAADLAFHEAVAAAARNALAAELYARVRRIGRDVRVSIASSAGAGASRLRQRDAEHRAVAQSIAARDADAAEAAMRAHMLAVKRRVMERLSPGLTAA